MRERVNSDEPVCPLYAYVVWLVQSSIRRNEKSKPPTRRWHDLRAHLRPNDRACRHRRWRYQSTQRPLNGQGGGDIRADNETGESIGHQGQVTETLFRLQVGDVANPDLLDVRNRQVGQAVGAAPEASAGGAPFLTRQGEQQVQNVPAGQKSGHGLSEALCGSIQGAIRAIPCGPPFGDAAAGWLAPTPRCLAPGWSVVAAGLPFGNVLAD